MNRRTWIVCLAAWSCCALVSARAQTPSRSVALEASSESFQVRSFSGGPSPEGSLELCESLRVELKRLWDATDQGSGWQPRCEIILHGTSTSYLNAVGSAAAQTKGCSLIELRSGKISRRRIDLRVEQDGSVPALAHELTHIVLADRFGGRQPPHWLDEGLAMLADTREKRLLHERDCHDALASGRSLPLTQLLHLEGFSSADQMPAFYGQSLSLVQMLAQHDKPHRIIDFAVDSMNHGYPRALQAHYGIDGIHELEARWKTFAASQARTPPAPMTLFTQSAANPVKSGLLGANREGPSAE